MIYRMVGQMLAFGLRFAFHTVLDVYDSEFILNSFILNSVMRLIHPINSLLYSLILNSLFQCCCTCHLFVPLFPQLGSVAMRAIADGQRFFQGGSLFLIQCKATARTGWVGVVILRHLQHGERIGMREYNTL